MSRIQTPHFILTLLDSQEYPTTAPQELYASPRSHLSDEMSLPSVPSYFDDNATIGSGDEDDYDAVDLPDYLKTLDHQMAEIINIQDLTVDLGAELGAALSAELSAALASELSADLSVEFESSSDNGSCDTVVLKNALDADMLQKLDADMLKESNNIYLDSKSHISLDDDTNCKSNQTLALPFRLIQFLPVEELTRNAVDTHYVVVEGNEVGVQVDMTSCGDVTSRYTARRELQRLDHETQIQARAIEQHVMVK